MFHVKHRRTGCRDRSRSLLSDLRIVRPGSFFSTGVVTPPLRRPQLSSVGPSSPSRISSPQHVKHRVAPMTAATPRPRPPPAPLEGQHPPASPQQWQTPLTQLVEIRHGAGYHHIGATAWVRTALSSALPRTTPNDKPRAVATSDRKVVRRSLGSTRVMTRSGRAIANGMPGRPAPLPISTTRSPGPMSSPTAALFRI